MQSRKMKITRLVLEKMLELGEVTIDVFFPPQYSYARISRNLFGLDSYPTITPRTFASLLSRLHRDGLVERHGHKGASVWSLTSKGKHRVENNYRPEQRVPARDGVPRLVIFDIPERERRKRDAIRIELIAYNFEQLQKSVWIGYNPLPEDFIALLDTLNLKNKVHILNIQKRGTLIST